MCFSNGAEDAAKQQTAMLEAQQKKHDDDVGAGKAAIDKSFGQFDQGYFDKFSKSFKDVYNPQLTDQYGIAKDKLYAMLAGNGQLGGSAGNNTTAQLNKTYANNQSDIANKATDATNAFKGSVDNTKTGLYSMNASAADPELMASRAQAASGAVVAPQSYPNLSNVFGDVLGSVATANRANSNSLNPGYGGFGGGGLASGAGSGVWGF